MYLFISILLKSYKVSIQLELIINIHFDTGSNDWFESISNLFANTNPLKTKECIKHYTYAYKLIDMLCT